MVALGPEFGITARAYGRDELIADCAIHVVGVTVGLLGTVVLVPRIVVAGSVGGGISIALYALGLLASLGFSAAYNLWPHTPRREWLRRFDHAAIYVMIAGTYSPLTFGHSADASSVRLGMAAWIAALLGVAMKFIYSRRFERLSIVLYLGLGWLGLLTIGPLVEALPARSLTLLLVGGGIYSAGVVFHLWQRLRYQNAIWHGFVLAAAGCHYAAILLVC